MSNYRIKYAIAHITVALTAFYLNSAALVVITVFMAVIPLVMGLFLSADVKGLSFSVETDEYNRTDREINIRLIANKTFRFAFSGALLVTAEFKNRLFETAEQRQFYIPINKHNNVVSIPYKADLCGNIIIEFKDIRACDMLGLFTLRQDTPDITSVTVYPRGVNIEAYKNASVKSHISGEETGSAEKGSDNTEIFDLRAYQSGDLMRSIHWKLSAKTGDLIVREMGNPYNLDTLLYIDAGLYRDKQRLDNKSISAVLETGIALGRNMTAAGEKFQLAIPSHKSVLSFPILSGGDYADCINSVMSITPARDAGKWLDIISRDNAMYKYGRIICVVWEEYPKALERIASNAYVSVIVVYDSSKNMEAIEENGLHIVTLPDEQVYDRHFVIRI